MSPPPFGALMSTINSQIHTCTVCGKTYQRKSHLSRHQAIHNDASRFECSACHRRFIRSDLLRKHHGKCSQRNEHHQLPQLSRGPRRKACDLCFRSKVTCDESSPCQRCKLRKLDCTYLHPRREAQVGQYDTRTKRSGPDVGLFLDITDPKAANMWRSFADDDNLEPIRQDTMANTTVLSFDPFMLGEDESFLQNFGGFGFELTQDNIDDGLLGSSYSAPTQNQYIPIFSPEAAEILKRKCASAIQDLYTLHHSLTGRDPSYDGLFDEAVVEEALSPHSMIRFAGVYFRKYHHVPIINRQSFGSEDTAIALLLAVSLTGAMQSAPRDDVVALTSLVRLIEEYIFSQMEEIISTTTTSSLTSIPVHRMETLQAAVIVNNVLLLVNNAVIRTRVRMRLLPTLVLAVRRLGLFAARHSINENETQYIQQELCVRIAHWTAMADWYHSIMFHLPPLVSITDMTGDMPDIDTVYDAKSALGSSPKPRQEDLRADHLRSIDELIRALAQDELQHPTSSKIPPLTILNLHFIVLGLFCMLISSDLMGTVSMAAPSISKAFKRWYDIWKISISKIQPGLLNTSGIERCSEEHYWAAEVMLKAIILGDKVHPYLQRVGHTSLTEFNAFLIQSYSLSK